ncbi:hypothetical protein D9M72_588830 [compost metagenome]
MADLARHDTDPIWTLAGLASSGDGTWPPAKLRERFPDPRQRKARKPLSTQPAGNWLDPALEWLDAFVAAGVALGVYYLTSAAWLAVLAFLCTAVALGFGIAKLRDR